ncbi:MAG TPA: hypothetical protein VE959_33705 [Bryobacteraceae bacterium]|nr:hypothetical protein [Bryobacteraceae bacterium]
MRRAITIFLKDARHLWPRTLIFPALLALAALLDPVYLDYRLHMALAAACWYVIVSAIHEEALPGDRQYWLTRPYTWRDLFAAKALFVLAFVNLPLAVFHASVWKAAGIPLLDHLQVLFWKEAFFTALYVLPAAAVAAVTRNVGQTILAGLLVGGGWFAGQLLMASRYQPDLFNQEWGRTAALSAVLAAGAAAVLLQYWRRRTAVGRGMLAGMLALLVAVQVSMPRAWAFQFESLAARERPGNSALRISLDPGAVATVEQRWRGAVQVTVPIRVEGAPPGLELSVDWVGGRVKGFPVVRAAMAPASLYFELSGDLLPAVRLGPLDVSGTVELTLFRRRQATPFAATGRTVVPGFGVCSARPDVDGVLQAVCQTPVPRFAVFLESGVWGTNWIVPRGLVTDPLPTSGIFEPLKRYISQFQINEDLTGARIVTAEPVAHITRDFDFRGVRFRLGPLR